MRRVRDAAVAALVLLAGIAAAGIGSTSSAYVDTTTTPGSTLTAAPDWTAPVAAASIIVKSAGGDSGYIKKGGTYYIYSAVSDSGNPAAGVASVNADASAISASQTAVSQTAGAWTVGGVAYDYRSPLMTAGSTLAAGTAPWSLSLADAASPANSATQGFSGTVDNTAPGGTDVQTTNVAGGTAGRPEPGDAITFTATEPLDPQAILSGWTGDATAVIVAISDGTGNSADKLQVYDMASTSANRIPLPLGTTSLANNDYASGSWVSFGQTVASTIMTRVGSAITVTLGTVSGTTSTSAGTGRLAWTPSTVATDRAGNPMSNTPANETGTADKDF